MQFSQLGIPDDMKLRIFFLKAPQVFFQSMDTDRIIRKDLIGQKTVQKRLLRIFFNTEPHTGIRMSQTGHRSDHAG